MISASISACHDGFVATLSDGRQLKAADFRAMANALHGLGVPAQDLRFDWLPGQRMMTAGQQVALRAELRRRERESPQLALCAA